MKLKLALVVVLIVAALLVSGCCCWCSWPSHRGSYRLPYGPGMHGGGPAKATPSAVTAIPTPVAVK